jgi:hypothetical protein
MVDKTKLIMEDSIYNLMDNTLTTLSLGPSIYSYDPMLFESRITRTPTITPQPLRTPKKMLLAMLDAATSQDSISSSDMDIEVVMANADPQCHYNETNLEKPKTDNRSAPPTTVEVTDLINLEVAGVEPLCHSDSATNAEVQIDSTVEPAHILKEAADVADGKASTPGASLGSVPLEMGNQKFVADVLGHIDLHGNGVENDQNTSSSTLQEPVIPQVPSNIVEIEVDSTTPQDPATIAWAFTIDGFIASITKSVPAPLIPQLPEASPDDEPNDHEMGNTSEPPETPSPPRPSVITPQRKSSRLAKKAKTTEGKGAIQVAEELLVKKTWRLIATNNTRGS